MAGFSKFYEEYEQPLYRFLLALSRDGHMAEELTQETFYQAFLHIDRFEGRCSVFAWLCQIGKNAYFKECRRKRREVSVQDMPEGASPSGGDPAEALAEREQAERLRWHLAHLPPPYLDVFTLRVYGARSFHEISQLYGKTESWARVTYYRAKEKLLDALEQEDGL